MISVANQDQLATWLCTRIGLEPTSHLRCIGQVGSGNHIRAVVGYDGYNGSSVVMHIAGEGAWLSRSFLFAMFDYPFRVLKCNVLIGLVPSGNRSALRLNRHAGFVVDAVIEGAHPDGALVLMSMRRHQCRFLEEARYGKEVRTAARA